MVLLVATRNPGKIREIKAMLDLLDIELQTLDDYPEAPHVAETGSTFCANAALKALALTRYAGVPTLADDSGLEVKALGGVPGIESARYAGDGQNSDKNIDKLLGALDGVLPQERVACFVCCMALAYPGGQVVYSEGECQGQIIEERRGTGGFGYDPIFIPDGYDLTFAELDPDIKNSISHRYHALTGMRDLLAKT